MCFTGVLWKVEDSLIVPKTSAKRRLANARTTAATPENNVRCGAFGIGRTKAAGEVGCGVGTALGGQPTATNLGSSHRTRRAAGAGHPVPLSG